MLDEEVINVEEEKFFGYKRQLSLRQFTKNSFLVSLPHLALLLIFLFYVLIGAAILKEIESDRSLAKHDGESLELTSNEIYKARLNEYKNKLHRFYDEDFREFKELNEQLSSSHEKFYLKFSAFLSYNYCRQ